MPLLVATVETLAKEAPEPLLHKDPHPKHYHGRCSRRHVYVFVCVLAKLACLPPEILVRVCCLCCMLHCLHCLVSLVVCL